MCVSHDTVLSLHRPSTMIQHLAVNTTRNVVRVPGRLASRCQILQLRARLEDACCQVDPFRTVSKQRTSVSSTGALSNNDEVGRLNHLQIAPGFHSRIHRYTLHKGMKLLGVQCVF
jgi:hypothetical protein